MLRWGEEAQGFEFFFHFFAGGEKGLDSSFELYGFEDVFALSVFFKEVGCFLFLFFEGGESWLPCHFFSVTI